MSHDPEEGVRVSAPAATLFGLSALLLSISMVRLGYGFFVDKIGGSEKRPDRPKKSTQP